MKLRPNVRTLLVVVAVALVATAAMWLVRGAKPKAAGVAVTTQAVGRQDIALTIEASGAVEPVDLVEVKSKASGQITKMPVAAGSKVAAGDLLAQIDTRDVRNSYDQALAALKAAQAKVDVSRAQKERTEGLFAQGILTTDERESAQLDFASAQAALVTAKTNLDLAQQRLDDATVRAPSAGTVLSQTVTAGQVISSATSSASGGTTLLTMADLSRIRMRALVAETDIGNVRPGQRATVTVDAFAGRTFEGVVEKIEPMAVVEQSVTNFPVLVTLSNDSGLLLPGMNGEVSLVVDRRQGVLAVPVDAVRSLREAAVLAPTLGLSADSVRAQVQRQQAALARAVAPADAARRDSLRALRRASGSGGAFARAAGSRRAGRTGGAGDGGGSPPEGPPPGEGAAANASTGGGGRAQVVFVATSSGIEPRLVRLGLSDFDWSEVRSGVQEGESVVLLGVAEAQASRTNEQNNIRQRVGSMPGTLGGGTRSGGTRTGTGTGTGGGR